MDKKQIIKDLDRIILSLMTALARPATKAGLISAQEHMAEAYQTAHRMKREIKSNK